VRDLLLHARTYLREGKTEFPTTDPANPCLIDGERIQFILREDTTLKRGSDSDSNGTRDAAAPRGEIPQLTLTGQDPILRRKLAAQLDCHAGMPAFVYRD
jgi:hypothetical protein